MTRMTLIILAVLSIIIAGAFASIAFAADAAVIAPTSIWFAVWQIVQPLVVLFVSIVGPVAVTWIAARLIAVLKVTDEAKKLQIEAQLRDALHASATNALSYAVTKAGLIPGAVLGHQVIETAATYVTEKNPDAIRKLGVSEDALRDIILSKVPSLAWPAVFAP